MRKIPVEKLPLLFAALDAERQLWLPLRKNGRVEFGLWSQDAEVYLDGKTGKSGKDFFFPQTEDIVSFHAKGKEISIVEKDRPDAPFVVFAMRGCDASAMDVLDTVFLAEPKDSFYEARRNAGIIVTLACGDPDESCFCTTFSVDPGKPSGDVTVWLAGDALYWQDNTEKGKKLTEELSGLLEDAGADGEATVQKKREEIAAAMAALPLHGLKAPKVSAGELSGWFESSNWEKMSEACLGCGTCTFVCPTCQCYDIQDKPTQEGGIRRFRCWDSCMYSDFTLMAHGNPRTTQLQRYRQRFMHKLVYFPQNNDGSYSCVGCGRCVEKCPSAQNIVKVIKAMS